MLTQKTAEESKMKNVFDKLFEKIGIKTEIEKEKFLNPDYIRDLHDPKLLPDLEKAIERIFSAITTGEKIAIYSDYDCDGIPGATILSEFLRSLGVRHLEVYIPDRNTLGYGLHKGILEKIIDLKTTLLITIDLGTTAREAIDFAEANGVNVIVIDHHEAPDILPKPFALINPKLKDSKYPFKELCGTGITYKVILGFLDKYHEYFKYPRGKEKWLLDLVALSTIADQVPLVDENRVLAKYGLMVMRKGKRLGLKALADRSKINIGNITEDDINFSIAPKINAASRMDEAYKAYQLLSAEDKDSADILSEDLAKLSDKRKIIVATMMKEANKSIKTRGFENIICVGSPTWSPGLLGLLASKLCEEYKKTTFVWGRTHGEKEVIKGSCRSFGGADVVEIMKKTPNSFIDIGGHKKAGGFSVKDEEIHNLPVSLEKAFLSLDTKIEEESGDFVEFDSYFTQRRGVLEMERFSPFGMGNPKPIFELKDVLLTNIKRFGKEKNHLELEISFNSQIIKTIAFFKKPEDYKKTLKEGSLINVIGFVEKSFFGGYEKIRIRILDIR